MIMKQLFVPFDIGISLKRKGFNEKCFGYFNEDENFEIIFSFPPYELKIPELCMAPTYQQVIDWFEKNYKIKITLEHQPMTGMWFSYIWRYIEPNNIGKWERMNIVCSFQNKNDALNESFKNVLKNYI